MISGVREVYWTERTERLLSGIYNMTDVRALSRLIYISQYSMWCEFG